MKSVSGIVPLENKGCMFYADGKLYSSSCFTGNMSIVCVSSGIFLTCQIISLTQLWII